MKLNIKSITLTIFSYFIVSCLVLPSPKYYNYKEIDNCCNDSLEIKTTIFNSSFSKGVYLNSHQRILIINKENKTTCIDDIKFEFMSKLLSYDSISIKNKNNCLTYGDTIVMDIVYYNNTVRNKIENRYKNRKLDDTLEIKIRLNKKYFHQKLVSN